MKKKIPNYRNPIYTENGLIDCEIEHKVYGWIPFTCDPNDAGSDFNTAALFDKMKAQAATFVPEIDDNCPTKEEQEYARAEAYKEEADPLFFKYQRGEATKSEWLNKIKEIRDRYPY
jgi:hypothetical protein